ncbi:redoxin domain-containing protein [Glaciecola sp. MH2013]|uniref:redoxin domain-containing protein n=1 Tax=Glaciecola sp. MH2013 TaxID=2785524 RepID=UPI00189ECD00|nr:redoxin domain-containing protein [Glaciecola sp. MH2013]MBF7073566.1 redoxin domain-containing protein [Glaciecola sp. MH2013]
MKTKGLITLACAALLSTQVFAAKVDKAAPDFTLQNSLGEQVSLSDYAGKYVVLEWTNHQCPYVVKHYGSDNMQGLQEKYTEDDVVWLSIISSAPGKQGYVEASEANELTKSRNAKPSHVLFDPDGTVGKMYAAKTTPHMYIIDPEGDLRYAGAIDSIKSANPADIPKATNYVVAGMDALQAGGSPEKKLTPPYGCSIKYKS